MSLSEPESSKPIFQRLKAVCVPLLGSASLSPASIPKTSQLLSELIAILRDLHASEIVLSESMISYTFFPISSILKRNASADIPNQILEKILLSLELLSEDWWWTCDTTIWQQIFMLSGAILGGMEMPQKERDDETKEAAARCIWSLLRIRDGNDERIHAYFAEPRFTLFQGFARSPKFVPILGQTLNSLLTVTDSHSLSLQITSLKVVHVLLSSYFPDALLPSVLPGVVSTTSKLALNSNRKGWANGDLVSNALLVLSEIVIKSIGDDVCTRDGAIRPVQDLEDIIDLVNEPSPPPASHSVPYGTTRTSSWLTGTSSQLHIALNALTPLVKHPSPVALVALGKMSSAVLLATPTSLPQSQTLLLSFLLSLSINDFPSVSNEAHTTLLGLLSAKSKARHVFVQTLMLHTRDNLLALPRLLPLVADAKVEHIAGLVEAVCRLATSDRDDSLQLNAISSELARLLGPAGGVEKWGWSLLSVLEFVNPAIVVTSTSSAALMLEHGTAQEWPVFPDVMFKNVAQRSTYMALVKMFHALGRAAGDGCLFSVEWFVSVGHNGSGPRSVAALWCACRLLEGCARLSLLSSMTLEALDYPKSRRLSKLARALAKSTGHLWDQSDVEMLDKAPPEDVHGENTLEVQHVQGVEQVKETLNILQRASTAKTTRVELQPMLHKSLLLQLIAICSGILQARFSSLFIDTLYPVLHSLVSPVSHLSSTALASLNFITLSTSHASAGNLLLSNFDYVLNAVSRRLTRRWLDVDATKVLVIMVRLVGIGIVEKAGDVVEECFDRLDDYHGYHVLVEGLIEVLVEVTKVVKQDGDSVPPEVSIRSRDRPAQDFEGFFEWFAHRHEQPAEEEEDYGPAPHKAWGGSEKEPQDDNETQDIPSAATDEEPPPTATQALTKQIVSRSLYFLTHPSPIIRARILALLSSSVGVLPGNAILPSIHSVWPIILNRLSDPEPFVVSAAASLVEALSRNVGTFMFRRIWDDVWPRFKVMLGKLDASDSHNALARRGPGAIGTESAYTHSHRLYRSLIVTMTAATKGVDPKDTSVWEVIVAFRRFLHSKAHEELQQCARDLYVAVGENNPDAVWLGLYATCQDLSIKTRSLRQPKWDIKDNADRICKVLEI
ncbi:armadillo-type protein [Mucidula mucida]|nr:armadillo-type protein [Mucidula mucida]